MTATAPDTQDVKGPEPELKRVLGPKLLLLFIVGDILGAGVYVTGTMAGTVGGIVWLPFLLAFIVATMTAFSTSSWSRIIHRRPVRRSTLTRRSASTSSRSSWRSP